MFLSNAKFFKVCFFLGLLFSVFLLIPALAYAVVPHTSISLNPHRPDGYNGWYRTTPTITLTSDQPGTTYYQWDSTSGAWTPYGGAFAALTGNYVNNTTHTLYYYSTSGADTEQAKFFLFKVDPNLPVRQVGGTCEGCHGPGAFKDQLTFLVGTSHDLPTDPIMAPTRCERCHKSSMVGAVPFLREDGIYDPAGTLHAIAGNDNTVCFACHANSPITPSAYPGQALFETSNKHSTVTSSGKALTRWPNAGYAAGMCGNCHDPHGVPGGLVRL